MGIGTLLKGATTAKESRKITLQDYVNPTNYIDGRYVPDTGAQFVIVVIIIVVWLIIRKVIDSHGTN